MSIISPSLTLRNAICTAFKDAIDAGASAGNAATLAIYSGTRPATPEVSINTELAGGSIKLLGTLTCSYPCGSVIGGDLQFAPVASDMLADNSGVATWGRISTFGGVPVVDVDASTTSGVGFLQMNTTNVAKDGPIVCQSLVISA